MKYIGIILILLALVIGILPQFTDCHSQGRVVTLPNGMTMEMNCYWTAMAEMVLSVPLAALGGMLFFSKRRETRLALSGLGALLGVFVVLVPVTLFGVCANPMMLCNMVMRPALVLSGVLVMAASLTGLFVSFRRVETL